MKSMNQHLETFLSQVLKGLEGKTKNRPEIQLADLCLYPVAKGIRNPDDKAFLAMKNHSRLIDCWLKPDQDNLKIKYYCFDDLKQQNRY